MRRAASVATGALLGVLLAAIGAPSLLLVVLLALAIVAAFRITE